MVEGLSCAEMDKMSWLFFSGCVCRRLSNCITKLATGGPLCHGFAICLSELSFWRGLDCGSLSPL